MSDKKADKKNVDLERRIREAAFALWEKAGRPPGKALEFWLEARRLVDAASKSEGPEKPDAPEMISARPL